MNRFKNNFAYIDGNNLYRGVKDDGWFLDLFRFRRWLRDKFGVSRAYYFIGLVPKETNLYATLQKAGYTIIFKEVVYNGTGEVKGNCDTDLVLQSVIDAFENNCQKQIIVTSDGDYSSLVRFLKEKERIQTIVSPRKNNKCSILLKRADVPMVYLDGVKEKLQYMKKPPVRTEP